MTPNRAGVPSRARMGLTRRRTTTTLATVAAMSGALLTTSTQAALATTHIPVTHPASGVKSPVRTPAATTPAVKTHPMSAALALAHATQLRHQEERHLRLKAAAQKRSARLAAARAGEITPELAHSLALLRSCESTDNYAADTGNGFYGAYQFDLRTWRSIGLAGLPHQASPAVQDRAAATLHAHRGWQPWPVCGRGL